MKTLRIELRGEFLDVLGGEGERAQFAPQADLHDPRRNASGLPRRSRRRTMIGDTISHSVLPAALRTMPLNVTMPVSGRLFDTRASATSISSVNSSSGRSGASQRISLTPGEPSEAVRPIKPSNIIRIMIEHRCQPEPDSPFSIDAGGLLVEMHRLRVEFGGKGQNLLARDAARSERAEMAGREIFECQCRS